jgi:UDP-N-acetylmuramate dehydrogenase
LEIKSGHSLANLNSWKVGGEAEYFCTPSNIDECIEAHNWAESKKLAITYLGLGSNVLISDKGIKGLVICTRKLKAINHYEEDEKLKIECMAGNTKMELLKLFLKYELSPALMFAGIPGDIGGGVVMNAGISEKLEPREFEEVVEWVEVLRDGEIHRYQHKDLEWTYRHCHGWEPGMLIKACISWPLAPKTPEIKKLVKEANQTRLKKQPLELPSCGSVFKNPLPQHSGKLIEDAGLKGYSIGGAQVSEKHANFIVNTGNAKASEMRSLIEHVQKTVKEKFSVSLQTEVRFLGDWY